MDCQSCCWVVIKENSCTKNKLAAPDINNNNNNTNTISDGNINDIYFHIRKIADISKEENDFMVFIIS